MQNKPINEKDAVEYIISQWQKEGFSADNLFAMETIGRIKRLEVLLMKRLSANYKHHHDLSHWEFDVLATLRRSGEPYVMSPTVLFDSMMVSSGTMTNRLQNLEKKQLIERIDNPDDKRSLLVKLTSQGLDVINQAVASHIQLENELVSGMSQEELLILNVLLKKIENQLPKI
ncbi:MarR family winged helix-turn-helix transcriptional regulator [Spirabiliibacterium falconis]|uniref:MarR family winged helix-turn-helix transcriptional regulator n=1 Tax=Spirabiliibacterium falconis TaxID=572023 RepID=UPI001AADA0AA|nr:MarR family transcriptional regulator [Spirabiliibacterium falconis]MBE2893600.1 MarR family transcriptional regulator [Spirabiliibacterium falconis]